MTKPNRRPAHPRLLTLSAALVAVVLGGCRNQKRQEPVVEAIDPRTVPLHAGDASGPVAWDRVVEACAGASVVLVGEVHGHPLGLDLAASLFEDILARNPRAVLSMEFYERDQQDALDDYVAGITNAEQFDKASFRTATNNDPGHRRMVEAARLAGRPVIASNAPRRYARVARVDGYDRLRNLTHEQRRLYEIPDAIPSNNYTERFRALMGDMGGHGSPDDPSMTPDAFLRSQILWDATMADSVADALSQGAPVVHVVGRFHSEFGTEPGRSVLADMIAQRLQPDQRVVVITVMDAEAGSLRVEDVGRGHFVAYVGPLAAEPMP